MLIKEKLLEIEECLTCDKKKIAFSDELKEVVAALKTYKGSKDITPLPHSRFDEDVGFHAR